MQTLPMMTFQGESSAYRLHLSKFSSEATPEILKLALISKDSKLVIEDGFRVQCIQDIVRDHRVRESVNRKIALGFESEEFTLRFKDSGVPVELTVSVEEFMTQLSSVS